MIQKFKNVIASTKRGIIAAAEQKLGRALTWRERRGVAAIQSVTLLEACHQAFTSAFLTPAEVLADLEYFIGRASQRGARLAFGEI